MSLSKAGKRISAEPEPELEVLSATPHGLWLMVRGKEHLLRFDQNPWFRAATITQLFDVELLHGQHLHWPDLDVDLHVDSLDYPERFPLTAGVPLRVKKTT